MPAMRMNAEQMTPLNGTRQTVICRGERPLAMREESCANSLSLFDGWMILAPDRLFPRLRKCVSDPICCISNNGLKFDEVGPGGERNAIQNAHACIVDTIARVGGVATGRGVKQIVGRRGEKYRHYSVAPAISTTPWLPSSPFCQPPGIAPLPPGSSPYFGVIYCDTIVTRGGRGQDYVLVQNFKSRQRECSQNQWRDFPVHSALLGPPSVASMLHTTLRLPHRIICSEQTR